MKQLFLILLLIATSLKSQELEIFNASSDLSFLKDELKDVQIVGLGEQNHTVGTTVIERNKLIKFLVDSLGFDKIVYETGMIDANYYYNEMLKDSIDKAQLINALFGIMHNKENQNCLNYIREKVKEDYNVKFLGIDLQSHIQNKVALSQYYFKFLDTIKYPNIDSNIVRTIVHIISTANYFNKIKEKDTLLVYNYINNILSFLAKKRELIDSEYIDEWEHYLKNVLWSYRKKQSKYFNRDSVMFDNLSYYTNKYPTSKFIIIASSFHLSKYQDAVIDKKSKNRKVLGNYLQEKYNNQYYFLAFTCLSGYCGYKKNKILFLPFMYKKMKSSSCNSLESYLNRTYNSDFRFYSIRNKYNLSQIEKHKINKANFLKFRESEYLIPRFCDGVYYIKTMDLPDYFYLDSK